MVNLICSFLSFLFIEIFLETTRGTKASPASDNLFKIREKEDRKPLPEEQASQFHCTVAHLLSLCMRARLDVQTLVSFLTTRVKQPNKDDWETLRQGSCT